MLEWKDHTWFEISEKINKIKAVILPVGSCEQHSLHLPLGMDTYSSYTLSLEIAKRLNGDILVLPPIWYGISPHHMNFKGTITLAPNTLLSIVRDIAISLDKHGLQKLIIINGHGGNIPTLNLALREIRERTKLDTVLINPWELISDVIKDVLESEIWGHACEFETSIALVIIPDKVRREKITKPMMREPKMKYAALWSPIKISTAWNTDEFTNTGSIGDPTKASKKKGEKLWDAMVERTLDVVKSFIKS